MKAEISEGSLVFSKKGRDKGRPFMVLWRLDVDTVFLTDGSLRPVEKPKKKNVKHLSSAPVYFHELITLYKQGNLKNSDVRKAMDPYRQQADISQVPDREG